MRFLSAILLSALLAGPALAQDFEAGRAAARTGDYAAALSQWLP